MAFTWASRWRASIVPAGVAIGLGVALAGCGGGGSTMCTEGSYYALVSDFSGFESWPSETYDSAPEGKTHVGGVRTVYLNHAAPAGATEFPLGTIIVKRTQADGKIFGRDKRGGCFNSKGANDWEWFELQEPKPGTVSLVWRGSYPPAGEAYGGDPNGGCNMCHAPSPPSASNAVNDYVLAPGLTFAGFTGDAGTSADADGGADADDGNPGAADGGAADTGGDDATDATNE